MVIKDKKILFLHIPKTAGQSITKFLFENVGKTYSLKNAEMCLIFNNKLKLKGPKHYHHLHLYEYEELNLINSLKNYFKFTVFRNPYSRFVSAFKFNQIHHNCETYKDFVKYYTSKKFSKKEEIFRHFTPQTWYIDYNLKNIDQYFFQENLTKLENYFLLKYSFYKKLNYENISGSQTDNLDNYTKDYIKEYYYNDFNLLGYNYETP